MTFPRAQSGRWFQPHDSSRVLCLRINVDPACLPVIPIHSISMLYPKIRLWLIVLLVGTLNAQPATVVTLSSVGDRIRSQNPDLAAARLRIREAGGRMNQAGRLTNPDLESSIEHNPAFREGKFEIGLSQRFPITGRLQLEKDISVTELKSSEAEVREVERQIVAKAREAVVKLLAIRQRRELLMRQVELAKEFANRERGSSRCCRRRRTGRASGTRCFDRATRHFDRA